MRGKGEGAVYKDARGYWTGSIELPAHDGTRRRKVIRRKLKKDLLLEMEKTRARLKADGDIPTDRMTVGDWFTYWLRRIAPEEVRPNTLEGYRTVVNTHVIPVIGKTRMDKVTHDHVERVTRKMLDDGKSSTYALLAHRTMAISFKTAWRQGRVSPNPAEKARPPRKAVAKLEVLSLEEAVAMLGHVASDEVAGPMWATSLLTGARRGEVIGLEWDRVTDVLDLSWQLQRIARTTKDGKPDVPADFEYRHLRGGLYLTRPKSSKGWRIIPLVDPLKSILDKHRENPNVQNEWGLVFASRTRANPLHPSLVTRAWSDLLEEMKIDKNVRLHDVRHTTVDLLSLAGVPDDIIMEIVGHSTRLMTQQYKSRMDRERLVAAMQQLSGLFMKPIEAPRASAD